MTACDLSCVNVVKGKDACWTFRLVNCSGSSIDITGWSFASLQFAGVEAPIAVYGPGDPGQDEAQLISFASVPTTGVWRLGFRGIETTDLAFDASATDVENALNALVYLSEVSVSGDYSTGFTVLFTGKDGKRNQEQLTATSALINGANAVAITIETTQEGRGANGIEVLDAATGLIRVKLSEDQTSQMQSNKATKKQDMVLCVRIGDQDLNIPVLKAILNVEENPFAA